MKNNKRNEWFCIDCWYSIFPIYQSPKISLPLDVGVWRRLCATRVNQKSMNLRSVQSVFEESYSRRNLVYLSSIHWRNVLWREMRSLNYQSLLCFRWSYRLYAWMYGNDLQVIAVHPSVDIFAVFSFEPWRTLSFGTSHLLKGCFLKYLRIMKELQEMPTKNLRWKT